MDKDLIDFALIAAGTYLLFNLMAKKSTAAGAGIVSGTAVSLPNPFGQALPFDWTIAGSQQSQMLAAQTAGM